MESKIRFVLKHIASGLYYDPEAQTKRCLTKSLFDAKRFYSEEQAAVWMEASIYAPDKPEEFRLIPVKQTIEEVQEDVQEIGEHQKHRGRAG